MLGAEGVLGVVLAFVEAQLPARCTVLEQRLSLTTGAIPPPEEYSPTDQPDLNAPKYPLVVAQVLDVPDMTLTDHEHGDDLGFVVDYTVRLHFLTRSLKADDVAGTELARNRLLLAATEIILLDPTFASTEVRLSRRRITAQMALYLRDSSDRVISPGYLELPLQAEEALTSAPLAAPPITTTVVTETLT